MTRDAMQATRILVCCSRQLGVTGMWCFIQIV
jgi:hypothetical protein